MKAKLNNVRVENVETNETILDVNATYEDEDLVAQTGMYLDLNAPQEFSEPTLGVHRVVIQEWDNQPETTTHPNKDTWSPEEERHYDARIELHLRDDENGVLYKKHVYAKGLQSFAKNLNRQACGRLAGVPLSQRMDYFKTHPLTIWVKWSEEFDCSVIYFYDIEKYLERHPR